MTGDGFPLDAFEFLRWVTLIPLLVMLLGQARNRSGTDEDAPRDTDDKDLRGDDHLDGPKHQ